MIKVFKCPDCEKEIYVDDSFQVGEIISCPCCGLELEIKLEENKMKLVELVIEGEDFGE